MHYQNDTILKATGHSWPIGLASVANKQFKIHWASCQHTCNKGRIEGEVRRGGKEMEYASLSFFLLQRDQSLGNSLEGIIHNKVKG